MASSGDRELAPLVAACKVDVRESSDLTPFRDEEDINACSTDVQAPEADHLETSSRSSPGSMASRAGTTQGETGESTGGTSQENDWAECGMGAVGACGGGNPRNDDDPVEIVGQPDCRSPVVVHRMSITAVTIRTPVSVEGIKTMAIIDSGAEVTVLSSQVYASIPLIGRPQIKKTSLRLVVADHDQDLLAEGAAVVRLELHNLSFDWPVHVAPITDDLLLGSDVLEDIVVSSHRGLLVQDTWIPCETLRRPINVQQCRVFTPATLIIQPQHELVVSAPWEGHGQEPQTAVLEPLAEDGRGLMIARSLVDLGGGCVPVRMVNLSDKPIRLEKGHPLGELQFMEEEILTLDGDPVRVREVCCERDLDPGNVAVPPMAGLDAAEQGLDEDMSQEVETEAEELPEHLRPLYISTAQGLSVPSIRQQLRVLLCRRSGAFAWHKLDLGKFTGISHEINTACAAPVRERVRPTPRGFEEEERKCLEEQLEAGVIRPSSSAWAAPTVLVRKADGSVRWCCDYRKLNDRTVKDAYPLPKISMCLDSLSGARYFSTLDLQSGYWQVVMAEKDICKTAFITKYGLFEYTKMPFGLCSAPSTFQRCMELVFRGLQWKTLLIYLDDLIIVCKSMEENLTHLDEVLLRLEQAGLKLKPSKCQILQTEVVFLGHVVSQEGVRPNPKLVESVKDWKAPECRREVQQFLGLVNYYRRFIPEFSEVAAPLTELTRKDETFGLSEAAETAFRRLKGTLHSAPILSFPCDEGNFTLDTDASAIGIGAVLQQMQDGEEKVIAYGSKKLNKQQRRYCVTRRELLAIVVFLREFHHYLLGRPFSIRTDHNSLTWLLRFKEPQGQLARWMEYIYQFNFSIVHRNGSQHTNADALSRAPEDGGCEQFLLDVQPADLPCKGCDHCTKRHKEWADFAQNVDDVVPLGSGCRQVVTRNQAAKRSLQSTENPSDSQTTNLEVEHQPDSAPAQPAPGKLKPSAASWVQGYTPEKLRAAQLEDADVKLLLDWLQAGTKPSREEAASLSPVARSFWLNFESMQLVQGVAYLLWVDPSGAKGVVWKVVVPQNLRSEVLRSCHDDLFSAHLGVKKTVAKVKQRFHWPGLGRDVKQHIRSCATCSRNKMPYRKFRAALADFRVGAPMDRVAVDILGPVPLSHKGNRYVLVIVDYFTRWVEAFPLPDQRAVTVAHEIVSDFICRFGTPLELHTDQGRNFESTLFQEVCKLLEIRKTRSSPYHPSSNGLVERFNGTLQSMIRSYLDEADKDWDHYIPLLTAAYRATVHPATGFTPNFLMLGRETTTPTNIEFPRLDRTWAGIPEYVNELQVKLSRCCQIARENLKQAGERQQKTHDTRIAQQQYTPGQAVLKRSSKQSKLHTPWVGPYVVRKHLSDCLLLISDEKRTYAIHHDLLKPCADECCPRWALKLMSQIRAHPEQ